MASAPPSVPPPPPHDHRALRQLRPPPRGRRAAGPRLALVRADRPAGAGGAGGRQLRRTRRGDLLLDQRLPDRAVLAARSAAGRLPRQALAAHLPRAGRGGVAVGVRARTRWSAGCRLANTWQSPETRDYLRNIGLYVIYPLPGVFEGLPHSARSVNGSLWTLPVEFAMYLIVALVGVVCRGRPWAYAAALRAVRRAGGGLAARAERRRRSSTRWTPGTSRSSARTTSPARRSPRTGSSAG